MTSTTADFSTDLAQIRAQAGQVRFIPVLVTCIVWPFAALFTAIGWTFGTLWYAVVLGALTMRYGFCKGAHIEARPTAPGAPRQPSAPM